MTKSEILERLEKITANNDDARKSVCKVLKMDSVSPDSVAIASALLMVSGTMVDTMNTLALILCEMLPEKETEKAPEKAPEPEMRMHESMCLNSCPSCLCNTCANDRGGDCDACCVEKNGMGSCPVCECPDYVKEDPS